MVAREGGVEDLLAIMAHSDRCHLVACLGSHLVIAHVQIAVIPRQMVIWIECIV